MRFFELEKVGHPLIVHLTKGDDVLKCIQDAIDQNHIRQGVVVSGIGALRKVTYHRIADTNDFATNLFITVEGPSELTSIQGAILDGVPHLHIACCDGEHAFGGHLELGSEVQYLAEIVILPLLGGAELTRRLDKFNIGYVDIK